MNDAAQRPARISLRLLAAAGFLIASPLHAGLAGGTLAADPAPGAMISYRTGAILLVALALGSLGLLHLLSRLRRRPEKRDREPSDDPPA